MDIETLNDNVIVAEEDTTVKDSGRIAIAGSDGAYRRGKVISCPEESDLIDQTVIYPASKANELGLGRGKNIKVVNMEDLIGTEADE